MVLLPPYADPSMGKAAPVKHATVLTSVSSATNPTNAQHVLLAAANLIIPDMESPPRISYNLTKWKQALSQHKDQALVSYHLDGLSHGYLHGNYSRADLRTDETFPNLNSAFHYQDILTTNIQTELLAKRYLGPFNSIDAIPKQFRPFRNSPLGVIPKKHTDPPKFRTIQHLSYPEGTSVNDGIDPEDYRIQYESIQSVISNLLNIGSSALFWKADMADAFRTIPVHHSDWGMQGIYWRGLFFLDMYLPFGLRSAPYIFTSLMDLFVWICNHHYNLSNLSHFVDDFIYVAPPSEAWSSYKNFQNIASIFGVPFKVSKFIAPSPSIDYIGFHLDAPSMTISIPAEKRTRISTLLTSWLEISPPRSNPRSRSLSEA